MKFLLLLILLLIPNVSFSENVTSKTFEYTKVYDCGPKKYQKREITEFETLRYYLIHFDKNENVVIWNGSKEFKSFEKTISTNLYRHHGGERTLNFTKNDATYIFNLIERSIDPLLTGYYELNSTTTLIFDEKNLTYQIRTMSEVYKTQKTESLDNKMVSTGRGKAGFCLKVF